MPHDDPALTFPFESTLRFALQHRPWTVVFYSFRGGVGRTTALLSTAQILTTHQNRTTLNDDGTCSVTSRTANVAILDFDLEAPGIDAFPSLAPETADQPGLVEYIDAYNSSRDSAPNIRDYVYKKKLGASEVLIMRAGRQDENYRKVLGRLDFDHLYRFENGELLFENLRAGFKQEFACDLLLVDSRTGMTEIGGICLGHLADASVLVFQPTKAHLKGMADVVAQLGRRAQAEKRPIPYVFLSSKTPQTNKSRFESDSRELAETIVETCGTARSNIVVHDMVNVGWPDVPQPSEYDFLQLAHLAFAPLKNNSNISGSYSEPESYLVDSVFFDSSDMPFAFLFIAMFCWDSRDQVIQSEMDSEEAPTYLLMRREYEKQPTDAILNALLKNKWGQYWLRQMDTRAIDCLPLEHQVQVLKLRQSQS